MTGFSISIKVSNNAKGLLETTQSVIPAAKLFKALVVDAHNLIPKIAPQIIQDYQILQGDGGVGTIRKITFAPGNFFKNY